MFAPAPRESVWVPRLTSALLPRLAGPARTPFRVALFALLLLTAGLVAAEADGALTVLSVVGWPLLFGIYLWQSDVFADLPARITVSTAALGAALGVGWWLTAGRAVATSYGVSTGSGLLLLGEELDAGLLLTAGGAVLLALPAMVIRMFTRVTGATGRESLDGFVIGASGAVAYATAATTTILAPQFVEGLTENRTWARLLEDTFTYGFVNAVVTTAAGGLVGLRLWFSPRPGRAAHRARTALTGCALLGIGCYLAVWVVDALDVPRAVDLAAKTAVTLGALVVLRCGLQLALLHETPDPQNDRPILCVHCATVVPDTAFCVACGAAGRASSQSSRRQRRASPPTPV